MPRSPPSTTARAALGGSSSSASARRTACLELARASRRRLEQAVHAGVERQPTNANSVLLDDNEGCLAQRFSQVRQEQGRDDSDRWSARRWRTHNGGPGILPRREQEPNLCAPKSADAVHWQLGRISSFGALPAVLTYMDGLSWSRREALFRHLSRQHHLDEELHEPWGKSGSSGSQTASAA